MSTCKREGSLRMCPGRGRNEAMYQYLGIISKHHTERGRGGISSKRGGRDDSRGERMK